MEIKINWEAFELFENPYFDLQYIVQYKNENSILIYVWFQSHNKTGEEITEYYQKFKFPMIRNNLNFRHLNSETKISEFNFSEIPNFPKFIIDIIWKELTWKYLVIDIDFLPWIENSKVLWDFKWKFVLIKLTKYEEFSYE